MNEEQFILDMKAMLHEKEVSATKSNIAYSFRKRSEHSLRVLMHAKRLADFHPYANKDVLYTAAIFHDVGYAVVKMNHALHSEILVREYLTSHHYDQAFINQVCFLVKHHSNKSLLHKEDTPIEMVLLMEADLLDETGALSIIWDTLASAQETDPSYLKAYERLLKYSKMQAQTHPMVTKEAKHMWEEKCHLINTFIKHLEKDLLA